ncbi:MAG TPA: S53 family peptidase [Gaiellales bacterium]|nr:S53 family peptidase [Gaiellales bacterium]
MSATIKLVALAGVVAAVAAAQPAQAQTHHAHASPRMVPLMGSAQRSLAGANVVGHASPAAPVRISVFLKPRHQKLLAQLASQSSAKQGMSASMMRLLFSPSATARAQLAAYMRSQGFTPNGQGVLVSSFTGTAAQAERAFGVSLAQYKGANGKTFRAPTSAIHLPASIAGDVLSVDGLSTQPLMHPMGLHRKRTHLQPNALTGCGEPHPPNTFEPQQLAAANAYNSQSLLDTSNDGHGQSIALVEFSNFVQNDLDQFQNCFSTNVTNTRVKVGGGTTNQDGRIEVSLDQEVIVSQATGLDHLYTYVAKPSASQAAVLDAMLRNRTLQHLNIVSDSWGLCDLFEPLDQQAATNQELQLLAVAGMSFFVASGDDGASDCHRLGTNALAVDDPAGEPYATGVGGTTLHPGVSETVWGGHGPSNGGGGGGVSSVFRMPSWQAGTGVIRSGQSSKTKCGGKTVYCREVPDIAFNANPNTGYVIFDNFGWDVVGGTSAAAPLMAAFTADADTFSLANGGARMGFANPFLYHEAKVDPTMFKDVITGNNSILSPPGARYKAAARYDLATGWGSIDVNQMANDLAAYTRSAVKVHLTKLTAGASRNPVTAGHPSVLSGKLVDRITHKALPSRVIWFAAVSGNRSELLRLHTGLKGGWSVTFKRGQLNHRLLWQVLYVGEQGHRPAESPVRVLKIG